MLNLRWSIRCPCLVGREESNILAPNCFQLLLKSHPLHGLVFPSLLQLLQLGLQVTHGLIHEQLF